MDTSAFAQYGFAGLLLLVLYLLGSKLGGRALDLAAAWMKQAGEAEDKRTAALVEGFRTVAAGQERIAERLAAEVSDIRVDVARLQGQSESTDTTGVHAIPQRIPTPPQGVYAQHRPQTQGRGR